MKGIMLSVMLCFGALFFSEAQENKTIKEVSTVKRVVKKEGSKVIVKEVEEVEKVKGAVVVADDEQENQFFKEDTTKLGDENVLVDEVNIDEKNEAMIVAQKQKQEEELERSIAEAKEKAEAERKALEQKEKERQEALKRNRERLERRGKGVGKLKKKKRN